MFALDRHLPIPDRPAVPAVVGVVASCRWADTRMINEDPYAQLFAALELIEMGRINNGVELLRSICDTIKRKKPEKYDATAIARVVQARLPHMIFGLQK